MIVCIVVGGDVSRSDTQIVKKCTNIIAADGGANTLVKSNIVPDYAIGDMDSIQKNVLKKLFSNDKTTVLEDYDQNKTDFELALELAVACGAEKIIVVGWEGSRFDHSLASLYVGSACSVPIVFASSNQRIHIVHDFVRITGKKGKIISVLPLGDVRGLSYTGLKWNISNKNVVVPWFGVSNEMTGKTCSVSVKKGVVAVCEVLHE